MSMNPVRPFASMESVMREVLLERLLVEGQPVPDNQIGGDFNFKPKDGQTYYLRIDRLPGGRSDRFEGVFQIMLEVFAKDFGFAESIAFDAEAVLLGYPLVVEVDGRKVVVDNVVQNMGVVALHWEDDSVYRLAATYLLTARRH